MVPYSFQAHVDPFDIASDTGLERLFHAGAGETVEEVAARLTTLLDRLEATPATYLLVAHGDTLSILAALLAGDLPNHR